MTQATHLQPPQLSYLCILTSSAAMEKTRRRYLCSHCDGTVSKSTYLRHQADMERSKRMAIASQQDVEVEEVNSFDYSTEYVAILSLFL